MLGGNYLGKTYLGGYSNLGVSPNYQIFTPPVLADRPLFLDDSTEIQKALFKFYSHPLNSRYVMVFQLSDGTFVQDTSTPGHTNTAVPLPWDMNNPSAPYATSIYMDYSVSPPKLTTLATAHPVWIVASYNGPTVVSSSVMTLLKNAGYGGNLS